MRLEQDHLAKIKTYIHGAQAGFIVLAWALTIGIFSQPGSQDGRVYWYFALCWICIPIIIYLVMVPMWSRAHRFANVYAFAALDGLAAALWFTAWAATASYVANGKAKGDNKKPSGCDNFGFGSATRCHLATATTIFGVLIMALFLATTFISMRAVFYFKRTGMLPLSTPMGMMSGKNNDFNDGTQDAFSSSMRNDEFDDERVNNMDPRQGGYSFQQRQYDERYAPVRQNDNDHDDIAGMSPPELNSPLNSGLNRPMGDYNTGYQGPGNPGRRPSPGPQNPGLQQGYDRRPSPAPSNPGPQQGYAPPNMYN